MTSNRNSGHDAVTGIFNDSFPPIYDGVTLAVLNYARILTDRGHTTTVVTPWNPERFMTDYPVERYFSLPIFSRHPYRYGYPKLDFLIWQRLRKIPFKLIHSHSPFSAGRLGVYAARHHNVPLIGTFHSKYRSDLEHSFRKTPWMVKIIMKRILDFFNRCDEVWIPQSAVEQTVREYGYQGEVTVVENGNDLASIYSATCLPDKRAEARANLSIPQDTLSLLFVGQHIREKGIFVIVEALRILAPDVKFIMNFIGTGYALDELKRKIKEYGLDDRVTIHGNIHDRKKLTNYYAAADLFIFPSFYDNAPLVVREAAAMGTPSILIAGSTASEVIKDGINGFLTGEHASDYAATIRNLSTDRQRIERTGKEARLTLSRTWDDVVEEVIIRYDEIIRKHKLNNG